MKQKHPVTVTKLLQRIYDMFATLDMIRNRLEQQRNAPAFTVTFMHDKDRNLVNTKWSDQYYGAINADVYAKGIIEYTYGITSKGITFEGYSEREPGSSYWSPSKRYWYSGGNESNMSLVSVPNVPPPNYKGTMYLFHQEKIKETLSMLPAWAIACVSDY